MDEKRKRELEEELGIGRGGIAQQTDEEVHLERAQNIADIAGLRIVQADQIKTRSVEWLWHHSFPLGKISIIFGDPGLGKSLIGLYMSATVSTGNDWPDGTLCPRGRVIILSGEDDPNDTIVPRLKLLGADLSKIDIVDGVTLKGQNGDKQNDFFNLSRDFQRFEGLLEYYGDVRLILVDPISAYMAGVDTNKEVEVRAVLSPIAQYAAKHLVGVVGIAHINKSIKRSALQRISGSMSFGAVARSVWGVAKDQETGERHFILTKTNIAPTDKGFKFDISSENEIARINWRGPSTKDINELLGADNQNDEGESALDEAKEFLIGELQNGPQLASRIFETAKEQHISEMTLRRAKKEMGVISDKNGYQGQWAWNLPKDGQDGHANSMTALTIFDENKGLFDEKPLE